MLQIFLYWHKFYSVLPKSYFIDFRTHTESFFFYQKSLWLPVLKCLITIVCLFFVRGKWPLKGWVDKALFFIILWAKKKKVITTFFLSNDYLIELCSFFRYFLCGQLAFLTLEVSHSPWIFLSFLFPLSPSNHFLLSSIISLGLLT